MSDIDIRLMFAKPPPCKKVRNEPEDILNVLNVDGSASDRVIEL